MQAVFVGKGQHPQVKLGRLVAGEADEADFALLFGVQQSLPDAVFGEVQIGVVEVDDFVDLPDV